MNLPNMLVNSEVLHEVLTALNLSALPEGVASKALGLLEECEAHAGRSLFVVEHQDEGDGEVLLVTAPRGTDPSEVEGLLGEANPTVYQFERPDRWADTLTLQQVEIVHLPGKSGESAAAPA